MIIPLAIARVRMSSVFMFFGKKPGHFDNTSILYQLEGWSVIEIHIFFFLNQSIVQQAILFCGAIDFIMIPSYLHILWMLKFLYWLWLFVKYDWLELLFGRVPYNRTNTSSICSHFCFLHIYGDVIFHMEIDVFIVVWQQVAYGIGILVIIQM